MKIRDFTQDSIIVFLVEIFEELAYNYCKWLHDHKSRDLAVSNWREFRSENVSTSSLLFHDNYKTVF